MSRGLLRVLALVWAVAAVCAAAAVILLLRDGDLAGGFWVAIALLIFSVAQAAGYGVMLRRRDKADTGAAGNSSPAASDAR